MFYVLQNETVAARKRCPILLTDSATGTTGQSGIAISNIYPYVSINGGAFAGGAGTIGAVNFGQYYYEFDASEINTLGLAGIHITAPGCRDYDAIVQVAAFNMYSTSGAGLTAGDVWSYAGGRTITGGIADTVTNPVDVTTASMTGIANTTWNTDVSAYTAPSAGYDVHNGAAGAGISAYDVWNYVLSDSNTAEQDLTNINSKVNNIDFNVTDIYGTVGTINSNTQASSIALSVWGDDLGVGPNAPYGAGTAGTILYNLSLGGGGITAGDVWNYDVIGFGGTNSAAVTLTQTLFNTGNIETYVANQTPQDVWTYSGIEGRTITGGIADTVTTVSGNILGSVSFVVDDVTLSAGTQASIANSVWSTDVSGYASPSAGYDLSNATSGGGITAGDVWSYATRTITGGIADTVTTLTNRSGFAITGGTITTVSDKTGYSLSGTQSFNLTGNITGNLSGSVGSVSGNVGGNVTGSVGSVTAAVSVATASMTGIAGTVWSNATRTITGGTITTVSDKTGYSLSGTQSFNLTGNITGNLSGSVGSVSGSVASVTNPVTITTGNMASIASSTWNFATRTLTSGGNGISAYDVWNFVLSNADTANVNLVQASSGAGLTAGDVWDYGTRTLTSGGSGISAYDVWNYDGSYSQGTSGDALNIAATDSAIAAAGVTSNAPSQVWSYGTRTLTSGSGISAADVWNYNISGITTTGSAGKQLNDASVSGSVVTIVNGPYRLNSTAEGTDGRIDILQGSVQSINLSLVNGFGQPFNVTGYTLSVDIYDVSSSLVESYTPTVNYASGGNISFDIDTTVTDVIGTYSLVVSLTNGDVVQVGPITILVRPL